MQTRRQPDWRAFATFLAIGGLAFGPARAEEVVSPLAASRARAIDARVRPSDDRAGIRTSRARGRPAGGYSVSHDVDRDFGERGPGERDDFGAMASGAVEPVRSSRLRLTRRSRVPGPAGLPGRFVAVPLLPERTTP